MRRIDAYYLYHIGYQIHRISDIRVKYWDDHSDYSTKKAANFDLKQAVETLSQLLFNSVFQIKVSSNHGGLLLQRLTELIEICEKADDLDPLNFQEFLPVRNALSEFEAVLKAELGTMGIYLVAPKNAMDTLTLIESGEAAFPPSLPEKCPAAVLDVRQAMSCIAFELPTAAAFHLHRANEVVLKAYWKVVTENSELPKPATMGKIVEEMESKNVGKAEIRSSLRDIIKLHRNPTIHPEQSIEDVEEALNLYGAIRSVIGFMLKEIPVST
jgi:hypothetical protein